MDDESSLDSWPEELKQKYLKNYIQQQAILLAEKMDNMKDCEEVTRALENLDRTTPPSEVLASPSTMTVGSLPIFTDNPNWTTRELLNTKSYLPAHVSYDDLTAVRKLVLEQCAQSRGRGAGRLRGYFGKVIQKAVSRTNKKLVGLQVFIWGLAYGIPKKEIIHMLKKI